MKVQTKKWVAAAFVIVCCASFIRPSEAGEHKKVQVSAQLKAGRAIKIALNRGKLKIESGAAESVGIDIRFTDSGDGGWFSRGPSENSIAKSLASFNTADGVLTVFAGEGLKAEGSIILPADAVLRVDVETGTLTIAPREGRTDAYVATGTLVYDGAKVPKGSCVESSVKVGVNNGGSGGCASPAASLDVGTGVVTVL